jgi:cephalosporin hydroxylase
MNPTEQFQYERKKRIEEYPKVTDFQQISRDWLIASFKRKYEYNFEWLGRPIIQYPFDILAIQELIWTVKPDLIIETGIAHGGSLIFSASMLEIIGHGEVLGIDIDIREHNRTEIENHPMYKRINMLQGSSVSEEIFERVEKFANGKEKIMVFLDSNHTHEHVSAELNLYAKLVSVGSYVVVFDTFVEDLPEEFWSDRPWGKGNNPKTAVWEFLKSNPNFEIDKHIENKLVITSAPDGFLKRIS